MNWLRRKRPAHRCAGASASLGPPERSAARRHVRFCGADTTSSVSSGLERGVGGTLTPADSARLFEGATVRVMDPADTTSLARDGFAGERLDAVISCMASRTGAPGDAWAIDHRAHLNALDAARQAGVRHFVLLSAICVQKPLLAFQHAKLAFEAALIESGLRYSIVRPTAFFKSLSGQIERVRRGPALRGIRRWHADRLQAHQRRRSG
jgi:uncharacterized protein YbjT (DUF2867 family)